jgi:hypothetical protein
LDFIFTKITNFLQIILQNLFFERSYPLIGCAFAMHVCGTSSEVYDKVRQSILKIQLEVYAYVLVANVFSLSTCTIGDLIQSNQMDD